MKLFKHQEQMFNLLITRTDRMYYNNDVVPFDQMNLPVSPYAEDSKLWGDVIASSTFLPRVQLFGGGSDAVKEGKILPGRYGLVKGKELEDLTPAFDCLPLSWRYKAMQWANDTVLSVYDPRSPEWKRIEGLSDVKDSGCMFGVEFLLWLFNQKTFCTFYLSNKTSRREAPNLKDILKDRKAATVKCQLITKGKYKWHGPVVVTCSTPPPDRPDPEEALDQANRFANPKASEVEAATTPLDADGEERAR